MTDLEMTKLCAEAMGLYLTETGYALIGHMDNHPYDPLHHDAQAMALVKRLHIDCLWLPDKNTWLVGQYKEKYGIKDADLARAIVECVAKIQAAK